MSLVKKLPPLPSMSKVNAENKELLCIDGGGERQEDIYSMLLSPIKVLVRFISSGWIWG